MQSSPSSIYSQSVDKQRIVVVGKSKTRITEMIAFVLKNNGRKFDISSSSSETISEDAPVIIIEANGHDPKALLAYQHHILVFSNLPISEEDNYYNGKLADATPKGGSIFYDESDSLTKSISTKDRPDVAVVPYGVPKHELKNGVAILVTSTNEKFTTHLSSTEDLKNSSAAKELLKKIGISSGQFYRAISQFN